jgi:hypothetical protein
MIIQGSSQVKEVDYNYENHRLTVTFHSGASYRYFPVTPTMYTQLCNAKSKGKYLAEHIKNNKRIVCTKIQGGKANKSVRQTSTSSAEMNRDESKVKDKVETESSETIEQMSRNIHKIIREAKQ